MGVLINAQVRNGLIAKFRHISGYEVTTFNNGEVGLSLMKRKAGTEFASLIKIAVLDKPEGAKKILHIDASYGRVGDHGLSIRSEEETSLRDPIDIMSSEGDYFYEVNKKKIYKKDKELSAPDLVKEFYGTHIKASKPIRGAVLRLRMWFWRKMLPRSAKIIAGSFFVALYLMSGKKYAFDPIDENFNDPGDSLYSSRPDGFEHKEAAGSIITFLGYSATRWSIVFYSLLHLVLFGLFYALNFLPEALVIVFKNNFLAFAYVVVSLFMVESAIPGFLKVLIRYFSRAGFNLSLKKVKI